MYAIYVYVLVDRETADRVIIRMNINIHDRVIISELLIIITPTLTLECGMYIYIYIFT